MGEERENALPGDSGQSGEPPRPRKKRKQHHGDHPEKPIQKHPYAQKSETTHIAALSYLEEYIRQSGTWGEVVTGCHWKVGP